MTGPAGHGSGQLIPVKQSSSLRAVSAPGPGSLRIAALVSTYPPYRAGQGNVCQAQAAGLSARGHDVTVFTAAQGDATREPGPPVVERRRPVLSLGNAPLLPGLGALRGYDVIHLHQPFIFGAELAALGALASRTPVVSSFHNELRGDGVKGALFSAYNATGLRFALRRSARIAVLSTDHAAAVPPLAAQLRRRPQAIDEVPNGVDAQRFNPGSGAHIRARHGIAADAFVAMVCASLDLAHQYKRVDLAIKATAALSGERDVHLLVVGDGALRPGLVSMATALGIADRVTFAGELDAELPDHYRACDVLVQPSEWEAFGLVQIEAMATGKPVIVTSVAGARVVSVDGQHGLHVRPGDGADLLRALRAIAGLEPSARDAMGERGRARVLERYTWERSVDALETSLMLAAG